VIGMHFFNPVNIMQLVELVTHPRTDPALGKKSGRRFYDWAKDGSR